MLYPFFLNSCTFRCNFLPTARPRDYKDAYDYHFEQNRQQAQQWVDRLKREYYDDGNAVGTTKLFDAVKASHPAPGSHPTKRFVREWLRRQAGHQLTTRPSRKRGSDIQAVITSRPNELIQVDYMYMYRHITGELITEDEDMDEE